MPEKRFQTHLLELCGCMHKVAGPGGLSFRGTGSGKTSVLIPMAYGFASLVIGVKPNNLRKAPGPFAFRQLKG